jgi:hypothetical protein
MKDPRNPFRLRRSESIDTNEVFLGLFEPGILEIMPKESTFESVHIIRSAQGGGKTSLLRLFTPTVLLALHSSGRTVDRLKELYQRLRELGALADEGPQLLGVSLLCGRNYSMLQDLEFEQSRKDRLFFSLLNVRIVLAVLRSALALHRLEYPNDLARLRMDAATSLPPITGLSLPCTGEDLFRWAEGVETKLCEGLDSFGPQRPDRLPGHDGLHSLALIHPGAMTIDGKPVAKKVVLMMDDIHMLTRHQRSLLIQTVIEHRSQVGVWIAERFEVLGTQEMLASGAEVGRDVQHPVEIERYWRRKHRDMEKLMVKVADRRVRDAVDTPFDEFRPILQESLDTPNWEKVFTQAYEDIRHRVRQRPGAAERFVEWIAAREKDAGTPRERAISWRALEILVERESSRPQKGLFDDAPLDEEDLEQKDDSSVQNAAELFLAKEYGVPYYFGAERVSRLATFNIQQFLGLAGDAFEEAAGAALLRRPYPLTPERQHALMKAAAERVWNDIPRRVRHGREVRNLLEWIGRYSAAYTYRPTAPNDPGVGGTAILMSEREELMDQALLAKRPDIRRFAETLASALAHNLLVADLDSSVKKKKWMVLNLNRLLCVHFDLPLGYGLFKERPLRVLCQWVDRPFQAASQLELFK